MSKPAGRHRDAFGRQTIVEQEDAAREMYIRPSDGRLASLVVQGSNENDLKSSSAGWIRMGQMRRQVSPIIDLVHWTYSSVSVEGSEERHYDGAGTLSLLLKWVPSCIVLVIMLLIPQDLEGNKRNGGFYDPVRYRDWGYSKVSRNAAENSSQELEEAEEPQDDVPLLADDIEMSSVSHHVQISDRHSELETEFDDDFDDLPARQFRPRYLCFLHQDPNGAYHCQTRGVTDFMREHEDSAATDFIFLSYTRKQFCVATEKELATWDLPDAETRRAYGLAAIQDRQTLLKYGIKAALSAGKSAFWLDFECIRDGDNEAKAQSQSEDVYRICDIVRAAHSLAILLGPPISSKLPSGVRQSYDSNHVKLWLHEWGTRLWTLPEILLCSSEHRITIYAIGGPSQPEQLAKRNFAGRAWKDSRLVRQLVDHYEASVHLTPLELVSIALECFSSRQTDQFHDGDIAYALMGLLRRRPAVNKSDTSFEAFARLSLANDSDNLLERLLCMLPVHPDAPWHEIKDAWGARLWDIEPRCQIAGIVDDQTVTLDGAFGATIQWDSTEQVAFFKRSTLIRTLGKILLRGVPAYLIFALVFTITGGVLLQNYNNQTKQSGNDGDNDDDTESDDGALKSMALGLLIPGIIFLIPSGLITLFAPAMLLDIYRGKFWSTQALFIGIEGMVDIGEAERHLFGFNHGRLKWSTNGSTLSRHQYKDGECVALPPLEDNTKKQSSRKETLFTLIDTYAMTATCFYAAKPPSTVIVCGQEGGMQRAVLCSYNWTTQTFVRETVLRVKTLVLDRMFRVDRFRFALRQTQHQEDTHKNGLYNGASIRAVSGGENKMVKPRWALWKIDLILLPILWFISGWVLPPSWPDPDIYALGRPGIARFAGWLAALIPCIQMMLHLQVGHVIGVAAFLYGALSIGFAFVDLQNLGADIAFNFVFGVLAGTIIPAFVLVSGAWYTARQQAIRILLWGYGGLLFNDIFDQIRVAIAADGSAQLLWEIEQVVFSIICILLAGVSFIWIRTPDQARWMSAQARTRYVSREKNWRSTPWVKAEFLRMLRSPQIWFFFATSMLNAAFISIQQIVPMLDGIVPYWEIDIPSTVVALLFGLILIKYANLRIFSICIFLTLQFAANVDFCNHVSSDNKTNSSNPSDPLDEGYVTVTLAKGLLFLLDTGGIVQFLIWSLALSNTADITSRVTTIGATFAGYAIGGIIGNAYWAANLHGHYLENLDFSELPTLVTIPHYVAFLSVIYGLQILLFIIWFLYSWRANRGIKGEVTYSRAPATVSEWSHRNEDSSNGGTSEMKRSFRYFT